MPSASVPMHAPGPTDRSSAATGGAVVGLDIVRFLAAFCVVVYHYAFFSWHEAPSATGVRAAIGVPVSYPALVPFSWWGWVGVEVFFVISGLVICRSAERQSAGAFLRNRVLRLAPALWLFATLAFIVTLVYSTAPATSVLAMYVRSVALLPKGPWIDGVYWTLTVEAVFYVLVFVLIASSWFRHLRRLTIAASLGVFCFYAAIVAARHWPDLAFAEPVQRMADAYVARLLLLTTGAYFLVGVNLHLLARFGWHGPTAAALGASLASGAAGIWIAAEGTHGFLLHGRSPATPVVVWLVAVAVLALSLRIHRTGRGWAAATRRARSAGLASYPLYLVHNIVGAFLFGLLVSAGLEANLALAGAITACIAISFVIAASVEPALRARLAQAIDRVSRSLAAPSPTSSHPGSSSIPPLPDRPDGVWSTAAGRQKRAAGSARC